MTYCEALEYIHGFEKFGWVLGLDRMRILMKRLGNPQDKLRFIHIAGTNGKGSTTTMCASVLTESGYRCGMYTSPFVVEFRERFQINGEMIGEQEFADYTARVQVVIEQMKEEEIQITEFEAITAIAFLWFYDKKCDYVCLEVGLGGNYDATNTINTPLVSIITSISLDHVHILGDTIEKIAGEKAGIIKQNGVCVCYPKQDIEATAVLLERCSEVGAEFISANPQAVEILEQTAFGNRFSYGGQTYQTKLAGEFQIYNAVNVIEAIKQLRLCGVKISDKQLQEGIAKASIIARFEMLSQHPMVVVDGAHNLEGTTALAQMLTQIKAGKKVAIMGMLADKDYEQATKQIAEQVDELICVPVHNPRALSCEELALCAKQYCHNVSYEHDYKKAFHKLYDTLQENDVLLACGSLYMIGEMRGVILSEFSPKE